ncbi:MAG: hypothetical protein JO144_16635 [Actinobacteria bacterium]|nr:hypothetical protein [Actinomycetota bacterium]
MLYQFSFAFMRKVKRFDYAGLIPRWTFFAPNPASSDHDVYYRDLLDNDRLTPWRPLLLRQKHAMLPLLINLDKRRQKAFSDFVRSLSRRKRTITGEDPSLQLTIPYIAILKYLSESSVYHDPQTVACQFAIVQSFGFVTDRDPRVVMQSGLHRLRPCA